MSKFRVLICDDAAFMRLMIRDILEPFGFEVAGEAASGEQAIQRYFEVKPDIVTLDIVMPEGGGMRALKKILRKDAAARVVMITAIDQRESLMEAIRAGAKDFIVKPFTEERVLSAVRKTLGIQEAG